MDERPAMLISPSEEPCVTVASRLLLSVLCLLLPGATGCQLTGAASYAGVNTIQVPAEQRDQVWERAVSVLNRNHFLVSRESKLEGVIETDYRAGSNLFEPWHPDSQGFENRLESTLQSMRRRVIVSLQNTSPGLTTVSVRVDKELEDLPGLAANYEGGATFREAQPLTRDLTQVVGQSSPSRWLAVGRDGLLEKKLLQEIVGLPQR